YFQLLAFSFKLQKITTTMKYNQPLLLLPLLLILIASCASREELVYFQGDPPNLDSVRHYTPTLQPDDLLAITVSAADLEATLPFNQVNPYIGRAGGGQNMDRQITYLI